MLAAKLVAHILPATTPSQLKVVQPVYTAHNTSQAVIIIFTPKSTLQFCRSSATITQSGE
ncbi:MAG: hypothetical protein LBU14_00770 [Candidatus Peribacteria bacterium]|jgi:hypothetical protein|nr:hypothetical protein [Candidatus Peribacteria bacterium]